ncbi:MAG: BrxA/BrxB family bacilliredoxin [Longimicrobiales bacterium]|nr:BrxA/BrxB family bacilliredoxin [Longimicrobiales bacterium]
MPYPEMLVAPMREDLTRVGFKELRTAQEVDDCLGEEQRTTIVAVNSVCGCAAGAMRPAVALSLQNSAKPEVLLTVFAGQDLEATEKARGYFLGYPPSSPSIALMKKGEIVHMVERHEIEGRSAFDIAETLKVAYNEFC